MPTFGWFRNSLTSPTTAGRVNLNLAQVPIGATINRSIFGWNASILCKNWNWELLVGQPVYAGFQTVRSGYAGGIPHPDSSPLPELGYPNERWLWYELAELVPAITPDHRSWSKSVLLRTVGTYEERQCLTQVFNSNAGQTLNVWFSLSFPPIVLQALELNVTAYTSVLYSLWLPDRSSTWPTTTGLAPRTTCRPRSP